MSQYRTFGALFIALLVMVPWAVSQTPAPRQVEFTSYVYPTRLCAALASTAYALAEAMQMSDAEGALALNSDCLQKCSNDTRFLLEPVGKKRQVHEVRNAPMLKDHCGKRVTVKGTASKTDKPTLDSLELVSAAPYSPPVAKLPASSTASAAFIAAASAWFDDLKKFEASETRTAVDLQTPTKAAVANTADDAILRILSAYNTLIRRLLAVKIAAELDPTLASEFAGQRTIFQSSFQTCRVEIAEVLRVRTAPTNSKCIAANRF